MAVTSSESTTVGPRERLDGGDLAAMFAAAASALQRNTEAINALNVFPVPDGDTGTNMFLTMQSGIEELDGLSAPEASEVAATLYSGTFMGARGNSGVILSQFFKGFAQGLDGRADFGGEDLARACNLAKENAYLSVANPVEGTILTVIASVAEATREAVDSASDLNTVLQIASDRARETVAKTTEMLPVLREAGVVDAGGQGLAVILEAMRRSAAGEDDVGADFDIQVPDITPLAPASVSDDFFSAHEDDVYGYCTQFVVEADGIDVDALRTRMNEVAASTVVIGDGSRAMVHAHAEDPGKLVSLGISIGSLAKVKIENMDAQHADFSRRMEEPATSGGASIVAVALGGGLVNVFRDLGVTQMVLGGNTMNPSVRDLMVAIDQVSSDTVFVLPNNKNIVPAAKQAAEESAKTVKVVETVSIAQGIAAMFEFDPEADPDENFRSMQDARASVVSGEITEAVRDVTIDGVEVRKGQLIGLIDGKLRVAGTNRNHVLIDLLGATEVEDGSLVTLYSGAMLTPSEADSAAEALRNVYDGVEVEVVQGGQPHYHFIISIE
jgi:DAK2 domain fusion protein YloV